MSNVKHPAINSTGVATITYSKKKYVVDGGYSYEGTGYFHYKVEVTFPDSADDVTTYAYFGWSAHLAAHRIAKAHRESNRIFSEPKVVATINL